MKEVRNKHTGKRLLISALAVSLIASASLWFTSRPQEAATSPSRGAVRAVASENSQQPEASLSPAQEPSAPQQTISPDQSPSPQPSQSRTKIGLTEAKVHVPLSDSSQIITAESPLLESPPTPESAAKPLPDSDLVPRLVPVQFLKFWFWFGAGMNFQRAEQSVPSVEGKMSLANLLGPTLVFRGGFQGERFGLDLMASRFPGKLESSATVTVQNGDFFWQTFSANGLYRLTSEVNARLGFQHHSFPFMHLNAQTAVVDVKEVSVTTLTAGFDQRIPLFQDLRGEWMMRYHYPILAGTDDGTAFSEKPKFTFDGSIGGVYSVNQRSRLGVYWYGQWSQFEFEYGSGSGKLSGTQFFFTSTIEARIGIEF